MTLRESALAVSTQKAYATHKKSFLKFCTLAGYEPIPVAMHMICEYIAYLSSRLAYASIKKYLGIIRIMHEEQGLEDPHVNENYEVKLVLLAVRKKLGDKVERRTPMEPDILLKIFAFLDIRNPEEIVLWAICLVGFYGLLRVSNILPPSVGEFNPEKHLTRRDFRVSKEGVIMSLGWAKNNQFGERVVQVPLPRLIDHVLCPVTALERAFGVTGEADPSGPAFMRRCKNGKLTPVLYDWFRKRLLGLVKRCGFEGEQFGTHSLRRGGASWALKCGLSSDVIRLLGDWKSDAYQCYLEVPLEDKIDHMNKFAKALPRA